MVMQAQGARRILDQDPQRAREALEAIELTGQTALTELRGSLGILREDGERAALAPQPTLGDLDDLVAEMRQAGLHVDLEVRGASRALADGVDRSAYRIVQEALTNTIKHAGLVPARVTVTYGEDDLTLEIADEGAGPRGRRRDAARAWSGCASASRLLRRRARGAARGTGTASSCERASAGRVSIRVLLVDDHALARTGLRMVLDAEPDIEVVGEAAQRPQAVHSVARLEPDVVLMDVRMPELDGIAATREIAGGATRVLILTTFDLDEYVYDALARGASGFLLKDVGPEQLTEGIRIVASGDALLAPDRDAAPDRRARRRAPAQTAPPRELDALTPREREVLQLVAHGALQRRDRRAAGRRGDDRQDARVAPARQARPARPRAGGDLRLRGGPRPELELDAWCRRPRGSAAA